MRMRRSGGTSLRILVAKSAPCERLLDAEKQHRTAHLDLVVRVECSAVNALAVDPYALRRGEIGDVPATLAEVKAGVVGRHLGIVEHQPAVRAPAYDQAVWREGDPAAAVGCTGLVNP